VVDIEAIYEERDAQKETPQIVTWGGPASFHSTGVDDKSIGPSGSDIKTLLDSPDKSNSYK
jgi:hypothetical protein